MSIICKGRIFKVAQKTFTLPTKRKTTHMYIEHPGAVLMVPFLTSNKIIMLKQFRPVTGKYLFELPAGTIEKGEKPLACAHREIIEETGFRAKKITKLGYIYPVPGYSTEIIFLYKAEGLTPFHAPGDSDEVIEPIVMTKKQVRTLFETGKLVDAKSISALALCKWL